MDFLEQLNDSQREAVEYIDGASLVIAGAGSGKTRVLTYKIAYLITQGYKPWEIMALTFTNKAAKEMKERIAALVGDEAKYLSMGTFHSVFSRILRKEADKIGYNSNFTIYDDSDSKSLCKVLVKQLELDDKVYKPSEVLNRISWAKNKLLLPDDYERTTVAIIRDQECNMPMMSKIYRLYVEGCRKSNAMDFDDLLVYTYKLFHDNPEVRRSYATHYRYFLVDEYQDTNYAQQQIVWQLASEHKHVCVVGDDAQSIYAFRGAEIDNILDFQKHYEGSRLFKLEQNYRSTQSIVKAANSLIKHNERQIQKNVFSSNDEGEKLRLATLSSDREEAVFVCQGIKNAVRQQKSKYSDFAILYRTNSQSRTFEEQMLKDGIPYHIYGGMSFFQRKEIKDVVAYFRLVVNHNDDEAFRRIVNYPTRGIGNTTVTKLMQAGQEAGASIWQLLENPNAYNLNISKAALAKLDQFRTMIEGFAMRIEVDDAFDLGSEIIKKSGISADIYSGTDPEDISRQEHLEEFLSSMQEFVEGNREEDLPFSLTDFLHDVSLLSDRESDNDDNKEQVTLMTIHSAKGLEFPIVYIVGLEENIFPSPMSSDTPRKLEEERRLFYVAITRAEKMCYLTSAKSRFRYGKMEFGAPSRFLRDIDSSLISFGGSGGLQTASPSRVDRPRGLYSQRGYSQGYGGTRVFSGGVRTSDNATQRRNDVIPAPANKVRLTNALLSQNASRSGASGANCDLKVGDEIEHVRFGRGIVTDVCGEGDSVKASVNFVNVGPKQLLLKFAKYKKL